MKKIFSIMSLIVFSLFMVLTGFVLSGCKDNEGTIRLNVVTHSIFYAPLYVAINNGYFDDMGLTIDLTYGNGAQNSMAAVVSNNADVALCGPEAAIYVANGGARDYPMIFGQLTKKDGSFLVGRTNEAFNWNDLINKEVIGGRRGGVPAMTLEYVMRQNGLIPGDEIVGTANTKLNLEVSFALSIPTFEGGTGDYCTMFEPSASDYVARGKGFIKTSIGQESGEVPYTAFIAKKNYITRNNEKIKNFLTAVMMGYNYIMDSTLEEVVVALKPSFTEFSDVDIYNSIKSYKLIEAWNNTPVMQATSFDRLQNIMISARELTTKVAFSKLVNNDLAFEVMQELNS